MQILAGLLAVRTETKEEKSKQTLFPDCILVVQQEVLNIKKKKKP